MKFEPTQPGNPHRLTIDQHVFPKASIQRFTNPGGSVEIFVKKLNRVLKLKPNNSIFCARRVWDQKTEAGIGKHIEDRFQALACAIEKGTVTTIGVFEKRIIEEFFRYGERARNLSFKAWRTSASMASMVTLLPRMSRRSWNGIT